MTEERAIHVVVFDGFADWEPAHALADVRADDVELLMLPGGDLWQAGDYPRASLEQILEALAARPTPIAAICAGTLALARARLLDDRRHTSNMRGYLTKYATEYAGAAHYEDSPAVNDGHVITASGLAAVDFARAVFAELAIFSPKHEALWYAMFKHGQLPQGVV